MSEIDLTTSYKLLAGTEILNSISFSSSTVFLAKRYESVATLESTLPLDLKFTPVKIGLSSLLAQTNAVCEMISDNLKPGIENSFLGFEKSMFG